MGTPVYAVSEELAGVLAERAQARDVPLRLVRVGPGGQLLDETAGLEAIQPGGHITPTVLAALIREHRSVRWVSATSAGVEPFLVPELGLRPVVMTRPRHVHDAPVAEFAMMLILAAAKRLPDLVRASDRDEWFRFQPPLVEGRTLVIVGYGEIGQALAARARPFCLRVIGVRRRPAADGIADEVWASDRLDDALGRADFVALTAPGGAENRGLIGEHELAQLPSGAYLINVGRGDLVDDVALDGALRAERFAGAMLDTFSVEPLPAGSPLWTNPRVLITPHAAGVHAPARDPRVLDQIVDNVRRFAAGEPLLNQVDLERGY